jgi:Type-F conjugative transfer system protein (TrbI_Ftype)
MASKAAGVDELPLGDIPVTTRKPSPSQPLVPVPGAERQTSAVIAAPVPRRFAGFTYAQLGIGLLILGTAIWGMWATSKIFALEDRRVVSVRLAAIVNDFVAAEARSGTAPEQLEHRTRMFMSALDAVLKKRADGGQVVLVGEAVIAASVPDVTADVVADLAKVVKMPARVPMPPAMPTTASPVSGPAGQSAFGGAPEAAPSPVLPGIDPSAPFGPSSAPAPSEVQP